MLFPNLKLPAFGLDIGDQSLKLVGLNNKFRQAKLQSFSKITVPEGYFVDGEPKQINEIAILIKKLIKQVVGKKIHTPYVISVLPENKTLITSIDVPLGLDKQKIEELIKQKLNQYFSQKLEEIYFDWKIVSTYQKQQQILVSAAPIKTIQLYCKILHLAGLIPLALEKESAAVTRAVIIHSKKETKKTKQQVIIDFGATRSSIIFFYRKIIRFTSLLPISGQQIDQLIAQKLKITVSEANKLKIKYDSNQEHKLTPDIFQPIFNEIIEKIKERLTYFQLYISQEPIDEIILCGGGAYLMGLDQELGKQLKIKVSKANPLINLQFSKKKDFLAFKKQSLIYATAIGLALRNLYAQY
ncbi:MAG: type IV pilus assembly protein PilM [Candidatus Aenigmarchaeota archaeon]|nr:type IV pilus assembly protein PilM [Candidatus Aenigmarchaeota archaeon]